MKSKLITIVAALSVASTAYAVSSSKVDKEFEVAFASHIEAGMAEQDVMVETSPGAQTVFRFGPGEAAPGSELFAAAQSIPHNPMDPAANGPHPKGQPLGMTVGDWLSAKGSASYVELDGVGHLTAEFEGLVPNGVYTMWHFFMSSEATEPFIGTFDIPVGDRDGSQSVFVADANGRAEFDQYIKPGLQLTGDQLMAGLAVAWHSDGKTYGVLPGEFGYNTHVQLFAGLPTAE
ncbi:MAG: hypothetical protein AAFR35_09305 [Pseudomonadota bacterium]